MKFKQLLPQNEWHTNRIFKGGPGIGDLPATVYGTGERRAIACAYRVSFLERIAFLFSGKIYVCIFGESLPPTAIGIGEFFERKRKGVSK